MNQQTNPTMPSTLFTIRLWTEDCGADRGEDPPEWRGKITNLRNQEVRYFRDAETLYGTMMRMMGVGDKDLCQMTVTSHLSGR